MTIQDLTPKDDDLSSLLGDDLDGLLGNDDLSSLLGNEEKETSVFDQIEYTGDPEKDYKEELTAVQQKYRDDRKREADQMRDTFDSEFWFCVVFDSKAQKEAFLRASKWIEFGEKYLDGVSISKRLGVELPPVGTLKLYTEKENKKLIELTKSPQ